MTRKPIFTVVKPGFMTTLQDCGRWGYQQYGIVVAGAMDSYSLQMANLLVGNNRNEACFEITMVGPVLKAVETMIIAITGADLAPKVNGHQVRMWKSFRLHKGDVLSFEKLESGMRCYISVAGGIDSPIIMGSKSTYIAGGIGQPLQKADIIYGFPKNDKIYSNRILSPKLIPNYNKDIDVRVILGPHKELFTTSGLTTLLQSSFVLSNKSDRMGYRLTGPAIQHVASADIISEPAPIGGIQVPNNGQPIILMADHQTTGGYSIIATVISPDISKLAQVQPGTNIRFKAIEIDEAQKLYNDLENIFQDLTRANE